MEEAPQRLSTWARLGPSLPDFALAGLFLAAWIAPGRVGAGAVGYCLLLMLLEFIVMHSSAFMGTASFAPGPKQARGIGLLGLSAFYFMFVAGFALAFKSWWPLTSFLLLTANRVIGFLISPPPDGAARLAIQRGWAVSALFYLAGAFMTVFVPMPRFGITVAWMAEHPLPSSGLWVDHPERVVAFGFLYFTALGLSEIAGHRWLPASGVPAARESAASPKPS